MKTHTTNILPFQNLKTSKCSGFHNQLNRKTELKMNNVWSRSTEVPAGDDSECDPFLSPGDNRVKFAGKCVCVTRKCNVNDWKLNS